MANSRPRASPDIGAVIAETYTIEALIGRGGMGSVFLATHNRLPGKRVAIKLLHVEHIDDEVIARFRREALIASQLDHPNIIRVDDYNVTEDGTPYLVLELLEGESLAQRLQAGPMPLEQVMATMRMVGSAVAAAHRAGIVHRDLKPQNIFLVPTEIDGQHGEVAKVLDFGISKMRGRDTVKTQESTLLGTPQYMAPEQATGQHATVDERTDIFALGAITYEMLTGTPAFTGENIPEVVFKVVYEQPAPLPAGLPAEVIATVQRAMQKKQEDRFASVGAFVEALTGRPLAQKPPATTDKRNAAFANTVDSARVSPLAETVASQDTARPVVTSSSRRGLAIALALGGVLAIGAIAFALSRGGDDERAAPVDAAAVTVDASPDAAVDAAIDAAIDAAVDAGVIAATPDAGVRKPVRVDKPDPVAAEDLRKAQAAFDAGDYELAKRNCNAVIGSQAASPAQVDAALLLRGTIYCKHLHNVGGAQADRRAITSGQVRRKLEARCGF